MVRALPIVVVLAMTSALAHAQNTPQEKLWAEGRALAKDGKYAEACVKFQQSYDLKPTFGTEVGLADCHENLGHRAVAWRWYTTAIALADNTEHADWCRGRADKLRAELGAIELHLAVTDVATTTVSIGGRKVTAADVVTEVVDPGEIDVLVSAPGKLPYRARKKVVAGATLEVNVPQLQAATDDPNDRHDDDGPNPDVRRRRSRVLLAYGVGGAGLAVAVTGIIIGAKANSDYDAQFGPGKCHEASPQPMCDTDESLQAALDARSLAKVGTVVGTTGWLLVAAGAVLWYTAPKDVVVTPTATASSAGISVVGRF